MKRHLIALFALVLIGLLLWTPAAPARASVLPGTTSPGCASMNGMTKTNSSPDPSFGVPNIQFYAGDILTVTVAPTIGPVFTGHGPSQAIVEVSSSIELNLANLRGPLAAPSSVSFTFPYTATFFVWVGWTYNTTQTLHTMTVTCRTTG